MYALHRQCPLITLRNILYVCVCDTISVQTLFSMFWDDLLSPSNFIFLLSPLSLLGTLLYQHLLLETVAVCVKCNWMASNKAFCIGSH